MAHENLNIDPVQGLIDYVNDIKPYHTKVIEALIEYIGVENVQVNITEDFNLNIGFVFEFDGIFICVDGGYGANAYDDPNTVPILSPDVSQSVVEYPAFSNGFFIVLGDRTELFDSAINLNYRVSSFLDDKLVDVTASSGSPPTIGGEFAVIGDRFSSFPVGTMFNIVGSAKNDGNYVSTNVTLASVSGPTIISVEGQTVNSENVEGFVRIVDPINTGSFVVLSSVYNRRLLTPHTTVFIAGISMVVPTLKDNNQRYVSLVDVEPLVYQKVLSYSNDLKYLTGSPQTIPTHTPDEGVVHTPIVNISTSPASFSILGNYDVSNIYVGDEFSITGSTGNNGIHTITSISYLFDSFVNDYVTTFGVTSANLFTIDGIFHINIPSNVFIIEDNYTRFFVQGTKVDVISGSAQGIYTTINSIFYNNSTHIRVVENIILEGSGDHIVGTTGSPIDGIVVAGDLTSIYNQTQQFNIILSLNNNGLYTTATDSVYDVNTNTTSIPIVEPFNTSDATGEIVRFDIGSLTVGATGFGETPELCEIIPTTLIHINIRETLFVVENPVETGSPPTGSPPTGSPPTGSPPAAAIFPTANINILYPRPLVDDLTSTATYVGEWDANASFEETLDILSDGVQYFVVNTTANSIVVHGDTQLAITKPSNIKIVFSEIAGTPPLTNNGNYTVNGIPTFDGKNTTIPVAENLIIGDSGCWVESI